MGILSLFCACKYEKWEDHVDRPRWVANTPWAYFGRELRPRAGSLLVSMSAFATGAVRQELDTSSKAIWAWNVSVSPT